MNLYTDIETLFHSIYLNIVQNRICKKYIPLYVNELGEGITKDNFGKEFKLNHERVKFAFKMFEEYGYSNGETGT